MKTIIKIVIALVIVTAAFQSARAAFANYEFEDSVHETLLFNPRASDPDIVKAVLSLARTQGIPVEAEGVKIRQVGPDLIIEITYETEVELIPGIYARTFTFTPSTSTRMMPGVQRR